MATTIGDADALASRSNINTSSKVHDRNLMLDEQAPLCYSHCQKTEAEPSLRCCKRKDEFNALELSIKESTWQCPARRRLSPFSSVALAFSPYRFAELGPIHGWHFQQHRLPQVPSYFCALCTLQVLAVFPLEKHEPPLLEQFMKNLQGAQIASSCFDNDKPQQLNS